MAGALAYDAAIMGPPLIAAGGQRALGWALTNPVAATSIGTATIGAVSEAVTGAELSPGADDLITDAPKVAVAWPLLLLMLWSRSLRLPTISPQLAP